MLPVVLGYIAAVLCYAMVGVGFFMDFTEEDQPTGQTVFDIIAAILWPLVLFTRLGQWLARPF